jgi:hypothetical protein
MLNRCFLCGPSCHGCITRAVTVIVPVLKSVAKKRIGKVLQRNNHDLDLIPSND